jgi:uncharacterized protein (DUF305 family)
MQSRSDDPPERGHAAASAFGTAMRDSMDSMMRAMHAVPAGGDPDRDFLAMMIPHHQAAIDMARAVLVHGRDPMVRQLAGEIIASQQAEIDGMKGRLSILNRGRDADPGGFPALGGTRGPVAPPPHRP